MTAPASPTFRDFASHVFAGDLAAAAGVLEILLGLENERARAAAAAFQAQTSVPGFLPKAMSLRTAVEGSDDAAIAALLADCFGLDAAESRAATSALRARYA